MNLESKKEFHLTDNMNLTYYLVTNRKSDRLKKTVWIESIYYNILKEKEIIISDLVNYLLESYFREMNYLDVKKHL